MPDIERNLSVIFIIQVNKEHSDKNISVLALRSFVGVRMQLKWNYIICVAKGWPGGETQWPLCGCYENGIIELIISNL